MYVGVKHIIICWIYEKNIFAVLRILRLQSVWYQFDLVMCSLQLKVCYVLFLKTWFAINIMNKQLPHQQKRMQGKLFIAWTFCSGPMCTIHFSLGLQRVTEFPQNDKSPFFTRYPFL